MDVDNPTNLIQFSEPGLNQFETESKTTSSFNPETSTIEKTDNMEVETTTDSPPTVESRSPISTQIDNDIMVEEKPKTDIVDAEIPSSSSQNFEEIKVKMLTHLSETDAHFKSQQRGEPDLTLQEKYDIAHEKLDKNPVNFLSQFGKYLQLDDLTYFTQFRGQYEIDFYVGEIRKRFDQSSCAKIVKNRRYSAMQKLIEDGEYFSEDEMKYRDPLLYEEMIGQYLTDDEIQQRVDKTDLKFSSILLKHIDQIEENKHYYYQKHIQDCQTEETESDGEDEKDDDEESELESEEEEDNKDKKPKISTEEQQQLKTEFLAMMQEKFLTGQDKYFFDYNSVDKNSDYDSLHTIEQDEQEKYFDHDDYD